MVLQSALGIIFGPDYRPMRVPFDDRAIVVGGVPLLSPYDLFVLVVAVVVMGALAVLFPWTSLGLQMRAAAFAPEVSRLLGVRVSPHGHRRLGAVQRRRVARGAAARADELGLNPHATDSLFVSASPSRWSAGSTRPSARWSAGWSSASR